MSNVGPIASQLPIELIGNSGDTVTQNAQGAITIQGSGSITVVGNDTTKTLTISGSGLIATTYTCDSGSATPSANVLNVVGTSSQGITSSGSGNTITFTISDVTTSQKGVTTLATAAEAIASSDATKIITPSTLSSKLGTQTAKGVPFGAGSSSALSWSNALTDGQLLIGSTGGTPAAANITSSDSSITVTNGANSVDLSAGSEVSFRIYRTTIGTNLTGDSTGVILSYTGTQFTNNCTITSNYLFTAPSAGRYWFSAIVAVDSGDSSQTYGTLNLIGSGGHPNRQYLYYGNPIPTVNPSGLITIGGSAVFDLAEGDTVFTYLTFYGGTKTVSIFGTASSDVYTAFTGYKIK